LLLTAQLPGHRSAPWLQPAEPPWQSPAHQGHHQDRNIHDCRCGVH
jgi:hypothetical protein